MLLKAYFTHFSKATDPPLSISTPSTYLTHAFPFICTGVLTPSAPLPPTLSIPFAPLQMSTQALHPQRCTPLLLPSSLPFVHLSDMPGLQQPPTESPIIDEAVAIPHHVFTSHHLANCSSTHLRQPSNYHLASSIPHLLCGHTPNTPTVTRLKTNIIYLSIYLSIYLYIYPPIYLCI